MPATSCCNIVRLVRRFCWGRQLTREDESIRIITLGELDAKDVDMFTMVSVGNSESRHIVNGSREWIYTPRGYSKKL